MIKDIRGSIEQQTGKGGLKGFTYQYSAFGVEKFPMNLNDIHGFAGYVRDRETDSYYANARAYLPQIHRFMSKDILRVDSLNRYLYVVNNPVNLVDPDGKVFIIAWSYGHSEVENFEKANNFLRFSEALVVDGKRDDWTDDDKLMFDITNSFARAATTRKQELINMGVPEEDIILERIDNAEDLKKYWEKWSKYDEVHQVDIYSHGCGNGPEVRNGSKGFWQNDGANIKLNWADSNYISTKENWLFPDETYEHETYFLTHGCNTSGFGQDFSNAQGVKVYAQNGYASFSTSKYNYNAFTRITHTDRDIITALQEPVYLYYYEHESFPKFYKNNDVLGVSFSPDN